MKVKIFIQKALLIALVLIAPLALGMILLSPMIAKSNSVRYVEHYKLKAGFTKSAVDAAIHQMKQDTEYQFYFKVLGIKRINKASDKIYAILNESREKNMHFHQIKGMKAQVQSRAELLNSLEYPPDFFYDPLVHIDFIGKFWDFMDDEFKLTVLGLFYKSTYDRDFQLQWTDATRKAAQKLEGLFVSFSELQRKKIQEHLEENDPPAVKIL